MNHLDPAECAFREELVTHSDALMAFLCGLTRNREKARDLTQETLIIALEKWRMFTPGTHMKAWLFVIARNKLYSEHRRAKIEAGYLAEAEWLDRTECLPQAEASYDLKKVLDFLTAQPRGQVQPLLTQVIDDLSYDDGTIVCGCARGTFASRLARMRVRVRAYYEHHA